jgi:hypothetical protein
MADLASALSDYLVFRFGITLERVLADATAGLASIAIGRSVEIACDPVGQYAYEDGGVSEQWQGLIGVEGVIYRFRCATFADAGGSRFVESIGELEVVRWGVRLALG